MPADRKWFTRLVVAAVVHDALDRLKLAYPTMSEEKRKELVSARAELVDLEPSDSGPAPTPSHRPEVAPDTDTRTP